MADYGEWNEKGATLTDMTATKEYGVDRAFIAKGIRAGRLECRESSMWGNPCLRLLRSQVERYIAEERGSDQLDRVRQESELRKVKTELASIKRRQKQLELRKAELETALKQ